VGYVIVMGREMATSQDFVNWVCSNVLEPLFLKYLLIAEKPAYRKFSSGSVHQTIYFPEVKAFHICMPHISEQRKIVSILDNALEATSRGKQTQKQKLADLDELKQSILQKAFTGQLTSKSSELEAVG
jgi:type I restriction enzyme S subunit